MVHFTLLAPLNSMRKASRLSGSLQVRLQNWQRCIAKASVINKFFMFYSFMFLIFISRFVLYDDSKLSQVTGEHKPILFNR